jgi:hypothetical protein
VHRFSFLKSLVIVFNLLVLTSLACGLGRQQDEVTGPPGGPIPVSQEAADRLKQNFYQSLQEATSTHEASLRISNEEITSLVANELSSTGQIPLSNPQVWFTAGRIYITGEVDTVGPVNFNSLIVATAVVDEGRMVVRVEEGQMGPFDFPASLVESMTQTVNEVLAGVIVDADLDISRLEILEGEMFVVGTRRT